MSQSAVVFPHNRLDAHAIAQQFAVASWSLASRFPRGAGPMADQLRRSSASAVLNIAEAANRVAAGEKRQRFSIARGEVGEAAAALELAGALGLAPAEEVEAARVLAGRVGAMLTQLIRRWA
jgi:four helix bundle protein